MLLNDDCLELINGIASYCLDHIQAGFMISADNTLFLEGGAAVRLHDGVFVWKFNCDRTRLEFQSMHNRPVNMQTIRRDMTRVVEFCRGLDTISAMASGHCS